ncbi:MAG: helix-turn-helix transcriptional regulator [Anaerolineales bacterium]|nr:helix-turn-helix transcriptional regulator [Anaerolineales bacterium]
MAQDPKERVRDKSSEVLPLLKTKLFIPPPRANMVPRLRLVHLLEEGIATKHQLIVISAPAGFGKTTLLCAWVHQTDVPVAWISLDEGDNDLTRFLAYFVAAIQTLHADIGETALEMQQSPQPPPMETVLTALINDLIEIQQPFALILDDYHVIDSQAVHQALAFLIDNIPAQMCLILSTRIDPPFPIARLRSRILLTELTEAHLRFTFAEAKTYLNHVVQLNLLPEDVAALEERTEGWIAGLQMAALSLQGRQDVSSIIRSMSGTHRYILDYLMEEVLDKQSPERQDFILKTSILDRLTASLCDAVLDVEGKGAQSHLNSQETLEFMDRSNLFIVPLDEERRWYRYHRLFADLLRDRLERTRSELVPILHRRASDWYEEQGLIAETFGHAMAYGDYERAADLVARNALAMVYRGKLTTLARWLEELPEETKRSLPWLSIAQAWALTFAGRLEPVAALLLDAEEALETMNDSIEVQRLSGIVDALRAYLVALRGDMALAIEFAREALKLLPDDDLVLRGFSAMLLASILRWNGDLGAAAEAYAEAIAINRKAGDKNVLVESLCDLATLQALQGQLRLSIETCRQALTLAEEHFELSGRQLPAHGLACIRMGAVLREWNDLQAAREFALQGLKLCERWGQADYLIRARIELVKLHLACGDLVAAESALNEAMRVARDLSPWYVARVLACEAELNLARGRVEEATRWADDVQESLEGDLEAQNIDTYLTLARIRVLEGSSTLEGDKEVAHLDSTLGLLASMQGFLEGMGAIGNLVNILILQALTLEAKGEGEQALAIMARALAIAEPEGFNRVFIKYGEPMTTLLCKATAQGIAVEYVSQLLRAIEQEARTPHPIPGKVPEMVESLSARELEVLRLLATHLSSTEIADELCVAVSTVRTHIKNIYGKLKVHSRNDAVRRAQEFGIL